MYNKIKKMSQDLLNLIDADFDNFSNNFSENYQHFNNLDNQIRYFCQPWQISDFNQNIKEQTSNNKEISLIHQHSITQQENQQVQKKNGKRHIKPSTWNKSMGLIIEPTDITKKKYIRKRKNPQVEAKQYPTKNILQNFRGAHLDFLQMHLQHNDLKQFSIYNSIKEKNSISMEDYNQLYNTPQFTQVFQKMFSSRYLYQYMMLSRSGLNAKLNHQKKLFIFEESFRSKKFDRIN